MKNKIFLFPLALAVIFFASFIIIFSPVGKKNIIKITPTVTSTPSSKPIFWQTYTNSSDNYQISYPSTWKLTKEAEKIILEKPDYARISIDSSNKWGITLPIKTWISRSNTELLNDPNRNPATTTIDIIDNDNVLKNIPNIVTVSAEFFNQGGKEYIFSYNKKIFSITGIYFIEDLPNEERIVSVSAEINEVLSTFKFLPDTTDWKTYTNNQYGFEFQYPKDWEINEVEPGVFYLGKNGEEYYFEGSTEKGAVRISFETPSENSFDKLYKEYQMSTPSGITIEKTKLGGIEAGYREFGVKEIFTIYNDYEIHTNIIGFSDNDSSTNVLDIYDHILSSFKFIK